MRTEKKEINIQIGKRLQNARENSGYTQEAFAEALDVSVEHYRKPESGAYGLQPEGKGCLHRAHACLHEKTDDRAAVRFYSICIFVEICVWRWNE